MEKEQTKLQIFFPNETIQDLEYVGKDIGIKRTDVVKVAVKKYVDDYKASKRKDD